VEKVCGKGGGGDEVEIKVVGAIVVDPFQAAQV